MSFLDKTGLTTLWAKIKSLVANYLPLSGGEVTGNLKVDGGIYVVYNNTSYILDLDKMNTAGLLTADQWTSADKPHTWTGWD